MADFTTIKNPGLHFNTKLYTGNGSTQSLTGVGFQPDFTWIKRRDSAAGNKLTNSLRGTNYHLVSNNTNAEYNESNILTAFGTDGFSVGNSSDVNANNGTFVAWNWKANGGTGSSNSNGSITSSVSANTTAGFSIVTYTGNGTGNSTIGHGLGDTPDFIIVKRRDGTGNWGTLNPFFTTASDCNILYMDTTNAVADDTNVFGTSAAFNNNTFTVGDWSGSNGNGSTYIAFVFAYKRGFSKGGKFTANNSSDGPFVYTGFKPAWVLFKSALSGAGWVIVDSTRDPENRAEKILYPSATNDEASGARYIDLNSNGFKLRNSYGDMNGGTAQYMYFAFAEAPLVGDNPVTAR